MKETSYILMVAGGLFLALGLVAQAQSPAPTVAAAQGLLNSGNAASARTMLEQVLTATPDDARALRSLGVVCLNPQVKDPDCALRALGRLLARQPADPQALLFSGIAHAAKGEAEDAFRLLGQARATRRIDMTQLQVHPLLAQLRTDARFTALMPGAADFINPFVEPVAVIRDWSGEAAGDGFGWIARPIGDVDNDGAVDFVTSAPTESSGGANKGRVYVFSSRTGARLWSVDGTPGQWLGLGIEAAGDVNGDGVGDVIASAPGGPWARVYDGRNGAVLLTVNAGGPNDGFGRHVSGIGDVNGDNVPDLIVGAPGGPNAAPDYSGRAYIFSGRDGALLLTLSGERAGDRFGSAVSGATANRRTTLVVGAAGGGPTQTGRGYVFHGLTQTPSFLIEGDQSNRALAAMFVGVPGDLDGDGDLDVYASDWAGAAKGPGTGRVWLYSGKTGQVLYDVVGENAGDNLGSTQATAGDVDGDGTPDLILGAWQYGAVALSGGRAYLHSGRTGQRLKVYTSRIPGDTLGFDAVGIGDVDGDGTVDLLITGGGSAINGFRSGRVFIISSGVRPRR